MKILVGVLSLAVIAQVFMINGLNDDLQRADLVIAERDGELQRSEAATADLGQRLVEQARANIERCNKERKMTEQLVERYCQGKPAIENYIRNRGLDAWFR